MKVEKKGESISCLKEGGIDLRNVVVQILVISNFFSWCIYSETYLYKI